LNRALSSDESRSVDSPEFIVQSQHSSRKLSTGCNSRHHNENALRRSHRRAHF
jgi:hypothetical protein